ncbi:MAG: (2Fe-2S)-binding protein [Acidobacteriota bacterium]
MSRTDLASAACDQACSPAPIDETDLKRCPVSGTIGGSVDLVTLKALLTGVALRRLNGRAYRFCPDPCCDLVYFDRRADSVFGKDDLRVRVGVKETEDPIPVCYCFDFTIADLRNDIANRGETDIPASITAEIQAGHCACEVRNPRGSCCLGDISRALEALRSETGLDTTAS